MFTNDIEAGGWEEEITGIWIAKYKAGYAGAGNSLVAKDSNIKYSAAAAGWNNVYGVITAGVTPIKYPVFMPEMCAYNYISMGDAYAICREMEATNNPYGFTQKANSHMMKNSEWGAVAYLTQSSYGRNGNQITVNSKSFSGMSYALGVTGYGNGGSFTYNTKEGQLANTTGNIYGIYDMRGCAWEKTAGYINNSNTNYQNYGGMLVTDGGVDKSTKFKTVYAKSDEDSKVENYMQVPNPTRKGEAIWETSISGNGETSWFNNDSSFIGFIMPFIYRGGANYNENYRSGLFCFYGLGGTYDNSEGYRSVLVCVDE